MPKNNFNYDAFISYRHIDGRKIANLIRRWLLTYKLAEDVRYKHKNRLNVFIDRSYGRATDDYYQNVIKPALVSSRFLIVVASKTTTEKISNGEKNWVEREIEDFLKTPQKKNIIPVVTPNNLKQLLPGEIAEHFERIQIINFSTQSKKSFNFLNNSRYTEFLRIIAAVRGVSAYDMPRLFREEQRRKNNRLRIALFSAILIIITISGFAVWAVLNGLSARRAAVASNVNAGIERLETASDESQMLFAEALKLTENAGIFSPFLSAERRRIRKWLQAFKLFPPQVFWSNGGASAIDIDWEHNFLVVGTVNSEILLWDLKQKRLRFKYSVQPKMGIDSVSFVDDRYILVSDFSPERVKIIDLTGQKVPSYANADGRNLRYELIQKKFLVTWADGAISLQDVFSGEQLMTPVSVKGALEDAVYLPNIQRLVLHTKVESNSPYYLLYIIDTSQGRLLSSPQRNFKLGSTIDIVGSIKWVTSQEQNGNVILFKLSDGQPDGVPLKDDFKNKFSGAFSSRNGRWVLLSRSGLFELWDTKKWQRKSKPLYPVRRFTDPVFSNDGDYIAIPNNNQLVIWSTLNGEPSNPLIHPEKIAGINLSSDGEFILTWGFSNRFYLWKRSTGHLISSSIRHQDRITDAQFIDDDKQIASSSLDGTVRIWKIPLPIEPLNILGKSERSREKQIPVSKVSFGSDAHKVLSGHHDGTVTLWNWKEGQKKWSKKLSEKAIVDTHFGVTEAQIFVKDSEKKVYILNADNGDLLFQDSFVANLSEENDSSEQNTQKFTARLAFNSPNLAVASNDRGIKIINTLTKQELCSSSISVTDPIIITFEPDESTFLVAERNGKVSRIRSFTCELIWQKRLWPSLLSNMVIHPNRDLFVLGGQGGSQIYNFTDGQAVSSRFKGKAINSIAFHPRNSFIVTADMSRHINIWNWKTGERIGREYEITAIPWIVSFDKYGDRFALGNWADEKGQFAAQIFDTTSGRPILNNLPHDSEIFDLAFSHNGEFLATASSDGAIRIWDVRPESRAASEVARNARLSTLQSIEEDSGAFRFLTPENWESDRKDFMKSQ